MLLILVKNSGELPDMYVFYGVAYMMQGPLPYIIAVYHTTELICCQLSKCPFSKKIAVSTKFCTITHIQKYILRIVKKTIFLKNLCRNSTGYTNIVCVYITSTSIQYCD